MAKKKSTELDTLVKEFRRLDSRLGTLIRIVDRVMHSHVIAMNIVNEAVLNEEDETAAAKEAKETEAEGGEKAKDTKRHSDKSDES